MIDESILPFLSQFDPPEKAEGTLDPLGLYSIADALAVRLAPGVRERQSNPRFLTLALVGMVACGEELTELAESKQLSTWLVYEWLVVEALVRSVLINGTEKTLLRGVPGREKVLSALEHGEPVCKSTYLKTPSVFGFHGVYRTLGVKARLFDAEGQVLALGYSILRAWEIDQSLQGFVAGTGAGGELRRKLNSYVKSCSGRAQSKDVGGALRLQVVTHLSPRDSKERERKAIWAALTEHDALRGEFARTLTSGEGQAAWLGAKGSEATFHRWLRPRASLEMRQLLKAIEAYEILARLLTDAFDEVRHRLTDEKKPVSLEFLAKGSSVQRASDRAKAALVVAEQELGEIDPDLRRRAELAFNWIGEAEGPASFAGQLLDRHRRVQNAKPPSPKLPWIDSYNDGRLAVRPAYLLQTFASKPEEFVHAYRTHPIWSFASELGLLPANEVKS